MTTNAELVELIADARAILIFTGAGISTGSGIPDFRGPKGLWKTQQPVYYQDFMSKEEARVEYWRQKSDGWEQLRDAKPNTVHGAIAELERAGKVHMVVTQNIDGLHAKAGTSTEKLVEIHGTNREVECQSCHKRSDPDPSFAAFRKTGRPPECDCGGYLKPATISFGQNLRQEELERAFHSTGGADLVISLGSTLSVQPAASIPLTAAQSGARYVVINRGETDHDSLPQVTLRLEGDVAEFLPPAVAEALQKKT